MRKSFLCKNWWRSQYFNINLLTIFIIKDIFFDSKKMLEWNMFATIHYISFKDRTFQSKDFYLFVFRLRQNTLQCCQILDFEPNFRRRQCREHPSPLKKRKKNDVVILTIISYNSGCDSFIEKWKTFRLQIILLLSLKICQWSFALLSTKKYFFENRPKKKYVNYTFFHLKNSSRISKIGVAILKIKVGAIFNI